MEDNALIVEWNNAVNCAAEWSPSGMRWAASHELLDALRMTTKALEMAIRSALSRDLYDSDEEYTAAVRSNVAVACGLKAIERVEIQIEFSAASPTAEAPPQDEDHETCGYNGCEGHWEHPIQRCSNVACGNERRFAALPAASGEGKPMTDEELEDIRLDAHGRPGFVRVRGCNNVQAKRLLAEVDRLRALAASPASDTGHPQTRTGETK